MKTKTLTIFAIIVLASIPARAQLTGIPPNVLEQSVIASGGGQNSSGGSFALDGTIGQPAAGTRLASVPFAIAGGFWTAPNLAPTAATVSVSGRVTTLDGSGLRNARVILTAANGDSQTILSGTRGSFRFNEVAAGATYIISIESRRYQFQPQIIFVSEDISQVVFAAAATTGIILQP